MKEEAKNSMESFPLKPIKKLLKNYYDGDISLESVIFTRDVLMIVTKYLAVEASKEFKERNKTRQIQGLPQLKRLDIISIKKIWERIKNQLNDNNIVDEVGKSNDTLLCRMVQKNE